MKILLTSVGTWGDIEPFLAIGVILGGNSHELIYSFPEQFDAIIPKSSQFQPLSSKVIELIESDEGKALMGKASLWTKVKSMLTFTEMGKK